MKTLSMTRLAPIFLVFLALPSLLWEQSDFVRSMLLPTSTLAVQKNN